MKWPFIGGSYAGRSHLANSSTTKNFLIEPESKGQEPMLFGTPGYILTSTSTVGTALPIRGILYPGNGNLVYCVQGRRLVSWNASTNVWTLLATTDMNATAGPVSMEINSASGTSGQIVICDGQGTWSWDIGTVTWASVSILDSNTVCFIDGRFIIDDQTNAGRFWYSDLYTASFTAFNFATAEGSPDYTRAVLADRRELWLFGDQTTEIWFDTGDSNLPFQRSQGGFIQMGIAAPLTAKKFDNSVIWLAKNERGKGVVVRAGNGYQPEVVSTPEINYVLGNDNYRIDDAYAMVFQMEGHELYVLQLPTAGKTFVLDALSKEWTIWRSSTNDVHKILCVTQAVPRSGETVGLQIGLSANDRSLYALSSKYYNDASAPIYRERTTSNVQNSRERVRITRFQIDVECGVPTTAQNRMLTTTVQTTAVVPGNTVIKVVSAATAAIGQTIEIYMDSGRHHIAQVTAFNTAGQDTITIDNPVTETAAIGQQVDTWLDASLTVEVSKDGGSTFRAATTAIIGPVPLYRVILNKLGSSRDWVFRLKTSTYGPVRILGAYAKLWGEDRDEPG